MSFPKKVRNFRPISGKTFPIRSDRVAAFDEYDFTTVIAETIQAVKEAVAAGELDTLLMAAKKERGRPKRKASR